MSEQLPDIENWSDEQIAEFDGDLQETIDPSEDVIENDDEKNSENDLEDVDNTDIDNTDEADLDAEDENSDEEPSDADEEADAENDELTDDADSAESAEDDEAEDNDESEVDSEAELERLFTPFRANGKDVQVRSVDEAIQLMQKGAGFERKMQQLKPGLKTLKLLKNHDLLEPEKVSLMIDATKGNKEALSQLIKDSGIDPLDLDVEADKQYRPNEYQVEDAELEFDDALDSLRESATGAQVIQLVADRWDDNSREIIARNPQILGVLDGHMANGIYDLVAKEVERERLLGRLKGLSDIEAYKTVGDQMDADGKFGSLNQGAQKPASKRKAVTKSKTSTDPKVREKRKAAGLNKRKPAPVSDTLDDDIYDLSDEEFEKRFG